MRAEFPKSRKIRQVAGASLIALLLGACGAGPQQKQAGSHENRGDMSVVHEGTAALPPSSYSETFSQIEARLNAFDWMGADTILATLPDDDTSTTDQQYIAYLKARTAFIRGRHDQAEQLLMQTSGTQNHAAIRLRSLQLRRDVASLSGDPLSSAKLGDQILREMSLSEADKQRLTDDIWHELQKISTVELEQALQQSEDERWRGWIELSLIDGSSTTTTQLQRGLLTWLDLYRDHPMANDLPGGLEYFLTTNESPGKVALLLPLSGRLAPAAKAVRDGYLASYYQQGNNADRNAIEVLDLGHFSSTSEAYEAAVASGAELVLGPLSKEGVRELTANSTRSVPVVAFNRMGAAPSEGSPDTPFIQLSLAPEDEAAQIAEMGYGQSYRRALILRPEGEWGAKMEQALTTRWNSLGGQVAAVSLYSGQEDYSANMAVALNLGQSEARARAVRSMLATNIEFTSRRRQDIDVVFLLARNGAEARSLKPLLAYHYAGDLPVYATSSIYRGVADKRDKDLNGINTIEIPWLLDTDQKLQRALAENTSGNNNYARLNALGADAHLLQSRISQLLQAERDVQLRGNTGLLTITPSGRVERQLRAATFDRGRITVQ
ncbi:MAG: penicillin-binding protein activator [Halioglobus sp.]